METRVSKTKPTIEKGKGGADYAEQGMGERRVGEVEHKPIC